MRKLTPTSIHFLTKPNQHLHWRKGGRLSFLLTMTICMNMFFQPVSCFSQTGTWTALSNSPANGNNGVMLLLTDGRVLCKNNTGVGWDILSPDGSGSYADGDWVAADDMDSSRTFCTSAVLQDGRVFVAGGEYGSGGNEGATYNPLTDLWSSELDFGQFISDAVSEILEDGRVMFSPVNGDRRNTIIWDPGTNTFIMGPRTNRGTNEATWINLEDHSILTVPTNSTVSERFIPDLYQWLEDATVPVNLYSPVGSETGGALLMPDGTAYFIGGSSNTAYYTPSNDISDGAWVMGPMLPNSLTAPDAAASMMRNGHALLALSPVMYCCDDSGDNVFPSPITFWEFDYNTETYTQVNAPGGGMSIDAPAFVGVMVNLPNGQILWGRRNQTQYYVYTPGSAQLAANRPQIDDIVQHNDGTFTLIGKRLNGWSEGSSYGDDWQMNSNYPIVRLTDGGNVYYARTYGWSCIGCVRTGNETVTTEFELPAGLPAGNYSLVVIANGIQSDAVDFCTPHIDVSLAVTDISCHGVCDGGITATPIGATFPTYSWDPGGENTATIANLCGDTYTITATNFLGLGCSIVRSIDLPDPELLTASAMATTNYNGYNISCNGGSDGATTVNGSGGTPPYTYHWDVPYDGQSPSGLSAGTYNVTVTDSHGCTATSSVTLTEPPPLTIEAGPNQTVYFGYPPAECATIAWSGAGGGVPPYMISWSDGGGQSHQVCPGINTTVYTVSITDQNNCLATDSVIICVIDVRCGNHLDKVELCHVPPDNPLNPNTLCVSISSVPTHLAHGDMLAACGTDHSCPPAMDAFAVSPVVGTLAVGTSDSQYGWVHGVQQDASVLRETTLKVYPNPFTEEATVEFASMDDSWATLKLFDHLGREISVLFDGDVVQGVVHKQVIDRTGLVPGIYLCTLQLDDTVMTQTLIFSR